MMKPDDFRQKKTEACITCSNFGFGKNGYRGWGCAKYKFTISLSLSDCASVICDTWGESTRFKKKKRAIDEYEEVSKFDNDEDEE